MVLGSRRCGTTVVRSNPIHDRRRVGQDLSCQGGIRSESVENVTRDGSVLALNDREEKVGLLNTDVPVSLADHPLRGSEHLGETHPRIRAEFRLELHVTSLPSLGCRPGSTESIMTAAATRFKP